jgi:ral guanine nucleotide dissociation stimulator-like 1
MLVDSQYIAEQLTYLDKCLFQNIYAHHCLASVWGTRYQKTASKQQSVNATTTTTTDSSNLTQSTTSSTTAASYSMPTLSDKFASMRAFIDQFNRVSFVVQGTVLEKIDLRPVDRAKIINKWIDIALECRKLKNFSSLNAIVQGLNTQCVSRLLKTWNEVAPYNFFF